MIVSSRYALTSGQMLGPIYPAGREIRITAITTGVVRVYASASPPSIIIADIADGGITPATLAARTVPRSGWVELGMSGSLLLIGAADGYSAIAIVAEGASATIDLTGWLNDQRITASSGVSVSLSTQPIVDLSAGALLSLPVASLPVNAVQFGEPSASAVTRSLLDGSMLASKGAISFGEVSMTVPDTSGAHADAIALAAFADAEFLLRLDRIEAGGFITDSTLLPVIVTNRSGADTIIDGVRAYEISAIITRQPMRIYNGV